MPEIANKRRLQSPLGGSSDTILGKDTASDARRLNRSHKSLIVSDKSSERIFWLDNSKNHHSEAAIIKTPFGKMPEWMTMQGMEYQRRARSIPDFLAGGHYGYPHEVYDAAAAIFERLAIRKTSGESLVHYPAVSDTASAPNFTSQRTKRQAYELAYEALKYQELLEEILADSGYFFAYPSADDTTALIVVMLFDFQNRKWAPRCKIVGEKRSREVAEIEQNLMGHRVRLAAALARCRVKNQSLSIDYVLPEAVRQQEKCASSLPQYAWINTVKTRLEHIIEELIKNHYVEFTDPQILIPQRGKFYRIDQHCDDVLLFPGDQKEALKCLEIVEDGMLVLQDKTSSLAAKSVVALLTEDDECDLIHTDVSSGLTTAHLAVVLHKMTKKRFEARELMYGSAISHYGSGMSVNGMQSEQKPEEETSQLHRPTVYAFGVRSDVHREQLNKLMKTMGLKNVKLLSDKFETVDPVKDPRFGNVKVILVTPQCTRTAVANPIEFMLNEGDKESYDMLRDLSHGERHKLAAEAGRMHTDTVKAALKFSNVQAVVYATRSVHSNENEVAVNNAIKWQRDTAEGHKPFRVCPPTLPLSSNDIKESEKELMTYKSSRSKSNLLKHNFLRMKQSTSMNGCFIAVLTREIDPTDSMTVKDILRRAALQGLIAPSSPLVEKKKPESPPKETVETVEEARPVEKVKRHKSKVAFGKKVKATSGTHVNKPRKSTTKSVEAVDVDKLLENYTSNKEKKVASKTSDVSQANINLEFHNPNTLKFNESKSPSTGQLRHDASKTSNVCMQSQINSDMERILSRMSSRDDTRT